MDLNRVQMIGEELLRQLRPRTIPVGINFFQNEKDIPAAYNRITKRRPFCAVVGMSRYYAIPVVITKEYIGGMCGGLDIPFGYSAGMDSKQIADLTGYFGEKQEDVEGIFSGMIHVDQQIIGFGIAPVTQAVIVPDLIMIWGSPAQMSTLAYSHTWHSGGKRVELATNGHGGSCYEALVVPYMERRVTLALADAGDRRHGYAGDDEMIMSIPIEALEDMYDGFMKNQMTRHATPTVYNFNDLPFPIPPEVMLIKSPKMR